MLFPSPGPRPRTKPKLFLLPTCATGLVYNIYGGEGVAVEVRLEITHTHSLSRTHQMLHRDVHVDRRLASAAYLSDLGTHLSYLGGTGWGMRIASDNVWAGYNKPACQCVSSALWEHDVASTRPIGRSVLEFGACSPLIFFFFTLGHFLLAWTVGRRKGGKGI